MRIIKRALWNVTKNYKKSILMLLVMCVIMILIISSLAIRESAKGATLDAQNQVTSEVILVNDMNKMMSAVGEITNLVDDTLISYLEQSDYVKDLTYTLDAYVNTDYKLYESNQSESNSMFVGGSDNSDFKIPTNMVYSLDDPSKNIDFLSNKLTLQSGVFPKDSSAKNPIIVSDYFLKLNSLSLGDEIDANAGPSSTTPIKLTIVGTFKVNDDKTTDNTNYFMPSKKENFYTDLETAKFIFTINPDGTREEIFYQSVTVALNSGKDLDAFIKEYESYDMDRSFIKLISSKDEVDAMLGSIKNIGEIANAIVIIAIVASITILALIIMLHLRNRRYELGLLLSLGENKAFLLLQVIFESMLILGIAIGISIITSQIASNQIQSYIQSEITVQDKNEEDQNLSGNFFTPLNNDTFVTKKVEAPKVTIDILNQDTLGLGIMMGISIVLLSTLAPTLLILKKDPKTLLLRRD